MPRAQTYSNYKVHNTVKFLVAIVPNGYIMHVSDVYGGRASDKFITADCGIEDLLGPGDEIMADRGFSLSRNLERQGVKLNIPTFTKVAAFPEKLELKIELTAFVQDVELLFDTLFMLDAYQSTNSTGVLAVEEPLQKERKFIVFESSLRELLTNCSVCGQAVGILKFSVMGTLVVVEGVCKQQHKLHWRSQPPVQGSGTGASNFLLAAGMLYSGCEVAATIRCLKSIGVQTTTEHTFYNYQRAYLLSAVKQWTTLYYSETSARLSLEVQTFSLESFHSVLNSFAPKSNAFSEDGIQARTWLAVLNFNENVGRQQALT
ncbi:hypothetical protein MRX96_024566 [Rhipicephalus microplus]